MFESLPPLVQSILNAILIGIGGALAAYLIYGLFARLTNRYIGSLLALLIIFGTLKWMLDVADAVGLVVILGTALTGALTLGMGDLAADLVSGAKLFTTRPFRVGYSIHCRAFRQSSRDHTDEHGFTKQCRESDHSACPIILVED